MFQFCNINTKLEHFIISVTLMDLTIFHHLI